jgi:hypothetical protein
MGEYFRMLQAQLLVHFRDFLIVFVTRNRCATLQKAAVNDSSTKPPYSHHDLLRMQRRPGPGEVMSFPLPLSMTISIIAKDAILNARDKPIQKRSSNI